MTHFAQIDENNVVLQVIVADQEFIDSGSVGDPSKWLQCSPDGSIRGYMPGPTWVYHPEVDQFRSPKPAHLPSWVWNNLKWPYGNWEPPIQHPAFRGIGVPPVFGEEYNWDEENVQWVKIVRPKPYPTDGACYEWVESEQDWVKHGDPRPEHPMDGKIYKFNNETQEWVFFADPNP
jgi:hypothetical protein